MEGPVRRLIHEKRTKTERRLKPSETFARHFEEKHRLEVPSPARRGRKPFSLSAKDRE